MCVFCKIANGEIPSYKIYEDDDFLAFLDISQATIGHTLVIPKKHYDSIFDLEEETKIFNLVILLAKAIKKALNIDNVNILNNNGPLAGQSVNHFHIHIIPRYENDSVNFSFPKNELEKDTFINLSKKIIASIEK
ncbi:MAG: HIT family protein [Bacilli bacterium]|nr:HIT family protein [Bacilli bacterium]